MRYKYELVTCEAVLLQTGQLQLFCSGEAKIIVDNLDPPLRR